MRGELHSDTGLIQRSTRTRPARFLPAVLRAERDVLVLSLSMLAFSLAFQMTAVYSRVYADSGGQRRCYRSLRECREPHQRGVPLSRRRGVGPHRLAAGADRFATLRRSASASGISPRSSAMSHSARRRCRPGARVRRPPSRTGVEIVRSRRDVRHRQAECPAAATCNRIRQHGDVPPDRLPARTARRRGVARDDRAFVDGFQRVLLVALAVVSSPPLHSTSSRRQRGHARKVLRGHRPDTRRPADDAGDTPTLLVADTLVRFANGMVYVFFVIVVVEFLSVGFTGFGLHCGRTPSSASCSASRWSSPPLDGSRRKAHRLGRPVPVSRWDVRLGRLSAPAHLRAGQPVGAGAPVRVLRPALCRPARPQGAHRRPGGTALAAVQRDRYYAVIGTLVIPPQVVLALWQRVGSAIGDVVIQADPELAFGVATVVGLIGGVYFIVFGREFEAYE